MFGIIFNFVYLHLNKQNIIGKPRGVLLWLLAYDFFKIYFFKLFFWRSTIKHKFRFLRFFKIIFLDYCLIVILKYSLPVVVIYTVGLIAVIKIYFCIGWAIDIFIFSLFVYLKDFYLIQICPNCISVLVFMSFINILGSVFILYFLVIGWLIGVLFQVLNRVFAKAYIHIICI